MKSKLLVALTCALALLWSTSTPAFASGNTDAQSLVVDVAVARPLTFAMTLVGSVLFVASLPVAATSGTIDKAAKTLVVAPARDTFVRPLGDLEDFLNY